MIIDPTNFTQAYQEHILIGNHITAGQPGYGLINFLGLQDKIVFWFANIFNLPGLKSIPDLLGSGHLPWTILFLLCMVIFGEIIFAYRIKREKAKFNESLKSFVMGEKFISYFLGLAVVPLCFFVLILLWFVLLVIINLPYLLLAAVPQGVLCLLGIVIVSRGLIILTWANKKIFGKYIQKESLEEFEERQLQYSFRDRTYVKLKPEVNKQTVINGCRRSPGEFKEMSGQTLFLLKHLPSSKRAKVLNYKGQANRVCEEFLIPATPEEVKSFKLNCKEELIKQRAKISNKIFKILFGFDPTDIPIEEDLELP